MLGRRRIQGHAAIAAALERGEALQVLLVGREDAAPDTAALVDAARARGVRIWLGGPGDLRRMTPGPEPARALAMVGPDPRCGLPELFSRGGAVYALHGASYASNVGFAVRTAEVSGADGVVVDGAFNHDQRARIGHVSMGADRLLPVLFERTEHAVGVARSSGYRVIALEDVGDKAPWEVELSGALLVLVGNERHGLPAEVLRSCDAVVALPMRGFVPSYNLQGALAAFALERLRQLGGDDAH